MIDKPYRSNRYDLAVDTITDEDLNSLVDWLKDYPRLTMADKTQEFEQAWSDWLGVKYSVMVNSGSSADLMMYAALESSGRTKKRKIVVPATGWATTVAPAIQFHWDALMCETDPVTYGMNVSCLEDILKKESPDAVILVHALGVPNDMRPLLDLQKKYGFALLEDCCASHGACHQGQKVGTFGLMSAFSFYYGHHMSSIEGGVISTDDEELYFNLLMLRSHGWMKDLPEKEYNRLCSKHGIDTSHSPFTFILPGYNLRPTDLSAQVGLIQLPRLDDTVEIRAKNHLLYQEQLEGKLEFARCADGDMISSISFCGVVESMEKRNAVVKVLEEEKIDTRLFTASNLGKHPFWKDRFGEFSAPVADKLYQGGFFLPNNQTLKPDDISHIADIVVSAL